MIIMSECRRCGQCCMSIPSWDEMSDMDRAMIRIYDKKAELLFKKVKDGICPNLIMKDAKPLMEEGKATCKIYNKRFRFCRAFKCWEGMDSVFKHGK